MRLTYLRASLASAAVLLAGCPGGGEDDTNAVTFTSASETGNDTEPRFEELVLLGVIYSTDPAASVALLSVDTQQGATARTFRVRRGDRLGNTRVLQIQRTRVLVEVEEFGLTEQRALEVKRPGQGGSR